MKAIIIGLSLFGMIGWKSFTGDQTVSPIHSWYLGFGFMDFRRFPYGNEVVEESHDCD